MRKLLPAILLVAIAGELIALGCLLLPQFSPAPAVIPATFRTDPLLMQELNKLAEAANTGGHPEWMAFGDALLGQGAYLQAEAAYRRAVGFAPDDIEARFALAFCIDRTGRMEESNEHYRACLELPEPPGVTQSKKPFARYAIGRNLLRLDDETAAEAAFRQNPGFPAADYQLARILLFSGRPREAEAIVKQGLEKMPLALEWHRLHARVLDAVDRPAEAAAAREMEERSAHLLEVNFNVDYIGPLTEKVGLNRLLAEYESAGATASPAVRDRQLAAIEAAVGDRLIPERFLVARLRAELAVETDAPELAIKTIAAAEKLGSRDPALLELKTDALEQSGRLAEATSLRERLLSIRPTPRLCRQLAEARAAAGDPTARDRLLARSELLEGIATYRRNDPAGAAEHFEQATELDPANALAWYHLGEARFHFGSHSEAAAALQRALAIKPGYGRARQFLDRIAE